MEAAGSPFRSRFGRRDAEGDRYYRAYFTADFVWHTALAAEIPKYAMPPHNPYLAYTSSARGPATAQTRLHYSWTYYLFPAVVSHDGPAPLRDVQLCLKLNALVTGVLLLFAVVGGVTAFVAATLIMDAIDKVGPDRKKVLAELANVKGRDSIVGKITFDEKGQNIAPIITKYVVQDGKWVVWEDSEYATGKRKLRGR